MSDVSIAAALFAGLLSFLSPCVLPLVPPYLVYLAGTSLERLADAEPEPAPEKGAGAGLRVAPGAGAGPALNPLGRAGAAHYTRQDD